LINICRKAEGPLKADEDCLSYFIVQPHTLSYKGPKRPFKGSSRLFYFFTSERHGLRVI